MIVHDRKVHFIGIGGIGMSGLAKILLQQGYVVSGSDVRENAVIHTLERLGAAVSIGHDAAAVPKDAVVVYSSAVPASNPEYAAALRNGAPIMHRSDMLLHIMGAYKAIAIAGTHGKTTNTALLTHVLMTAQNDPGYAIGGILLNTGSNGNAGSGEYFVAEADESDGTFTKYAPYAALITNIGDGDHLGTYGTHEALDNAFRTFASKVSAPERLYYSSDDTRLRNLGISGVSYGFESDADIRGSGYVQNGLTSIFTIDRDGVRYNDIVLSLGGKHNARNSMAIFSLALSLGVEEDSIRLAFKTFQGVGRRCEYKGEKQGVTVYDDYAHHPEEIKATLASMRKAVGTRRLIALYQPHRYSRTNESIAFFTDTFDDADMVVVTEIYSAGEQPLPGISSEALKKQVALHSQVPLFLMKRATLASDVLPLLRPGDVVVTLGAGDITCAGSELLARIEEHEA